MSGMLVVLILSALIAFLLHTLVNVQQISRQMVELRLGLVMPRKLPALSLSPDQQQQIRQWLTAHGTPQQVALRGRIILAAAEGQPETTIASQLGTHRKTVRLWRGRFAQHGS